jgi:hypothetical protein
MSGGGASATATMEVVLVIAEALRQQQLGVFGCWLSACLCLGGGGTEDLGGGGNVDAIQWRRLKSSSGGS